MIMYASLQYFIVGVGSHVAPESAVLGFACGFQEVRGLPGRGDGALLPAPESRPEAHSPVPGHRITNSHYSRSADRFPC